MNHTFISVDVEKAFDEIQYSFLIKAFSKFEIEGNTFNIFEKLNPGIKLGGEKMAFPT